MEPGVGNVATQLRRGVLEHCVLAVLATSPEYAFELVRRLSEVDGLVTSEGTIYPLLARLRRDGLVSTSWEPSESGPPRPRAATGPHRPLRTGVTRKASTASP
jgi:DNA-binding PadR family transcriptional regulator